MAQALGFIGIGKMGRPIAERLVAAGHRVIAHDAKPDACAGFDSIGATVADLTVQAEILFLSVPTPPIVAEVVEAIAAAPGRTRIVVDLSTTGPDGARAAAATLAAADITLVDCPVSGGVAGARAGTLALMAGADDAAVARVRPLLECFGRLFHVGPDAGMGQMMKVVNNLMSAHALVVAGEAAAMAVKAGLDPETVVSVLNAGSGRNSATLDKFPRQVLPGTFDAGFAMGLMQKDLHLCMSQAKAMELSMPASELVAEIWAKATEELGGDADFTRVVERAERAAGVKIRSRDAAVPAHG
ncbi:oxidoreductase [Sphingomonas metalli]|uniref:Oxidoreductase n=1 Tax=Sphingomonas metalli TaxID=1779358 RepID=A0A916TGL5_9SPHN|nr:NAD(P)-dependent oxidoreductase [Sphingomonas metalli]GGB42926.1 oxidoreductase [Sphingomonas metalli]